MNTASTSITLSAQGSNIDLVFPECQFEPAQSLVTAFSSATGTKLSAPIEVLATFVGYCSTINADIAVSAFSNLDRLFCSKDNIHVVVQALKLTEEQTCTVLRGYYSVWKLLEQRQQLPDVRRPVLFADPKTKLVAMFGGQGGMGNYMDEAVWLYDVYHPLLGDLVGHLSGFLERLTANPRISTAYEHPIRFTNWLQRLETMPRPKCMQCSTVAVPLVALVQIMHLAVLYKTLRITPGELVQSFKGAIGHSQGLIVAAFFATVTDEASFYAGAENALAVLTISCAGSFIDYPLSILDDEVHGDSLTKEGQPSPMVSISGLSRPFLDHLIDQFNSAGTSPTDSVHLSLVNRHGHYVVSGVLKSVVCFARFIRKRCALPADDQSHVPTWQRKPVAAINYVSSSVICHNPLMRSVAEWVNPFIASMGFTIEAFRMQIPVSAGHDGHDLRCEANLTKALVDSMGELTVDWPAVVKGVDATHVVDFSPGGFSVFALFTSSILDGSGTGVISASSYTRLKRLLAGSRADLYKSSMKSVFVAPNFKLKFGPRLVRTAHDSCVHINSPMFHILSQPSVMVTATSPTTNSARFVAAVNQAGYHAELSVSDRETVSQLREKIDILLKHVKPGQHITVCLNYSNQHQWADMFPAVLRMRQAGYPIGGVSISGGVPQVKDAIDIVASLRDVGISYAAFRASTIVDIRTVVAVAKASVGFWVSLLWMGGGCDYSHLMEDFHKPILETYSLVRSQNNILLIAASGVGDWRCALSYVSGNWCNKFGRYPMPFDGVALGSRVMTANEAGTAPAVKELIAAMSNVADNDLERLSSHAVGGVVSINSVYGEPTQVLATRAAMLVKELQAEIFAAPGDQQLELIKARRAYIIQRLNSDYMKPWFATTDDGSVVELEEMTYSDVVRRAVCLMFVTEQSRWIHISFRGLVRQLIRQIEDRFSGSIRECVLVSAGELNDPMSAIHDIERAYPGMSSQLLASEDVKYFIELSRNAEPVPVPFIPVMDSDLQWWVMTGTDWQSEDLDIVVNKDPQRVLVSYGSVSSQYPVTTNVSVGDILNGIHRGLVDALIAEQHSGDEAPIPTIEDIGHEPGTYHIPPSVVAHTCDSGRKYSLSADKRLLPDHNLWLEILAGSKKSWLRSLLTSQHICQHQRLVSNGVRRMLCPLAGQTALIVESSDAPVRLEIFGSDGQSDVAIDIDWHSIISVSVNNRALDRSCNLVLKFRYDPSMLLVPITEVMDDRDERIGRLFESTGSVKGISRNIRAIDPADLTVGFEGDAYLVTEEDVVLLCDSIGNTPYYCQRRSGQQMLVPMDILYAIYRPYIASITSIHPWNIGLLNYLHTKNCTKFIKGARQIQVGDVIDTVVRPLAIVNSRMGTIAKFRATFSRHTVPFAVMECEYLCSGTMAEPQSAFSIVDEPRLTISLMSAEDISVLETKEWFVYCEDVIDVPITVGAELCFELTSTYRYESAERYSSITTHGPVYLLRSDSIPVYIADVNFVIGSCEGNPVIAHLKQLSTCKEKQHRFGHGGIPILPNDRNGCLVVTAPADNWKYSYAVGDYTAIHSNRYIANYVNLPDIVTNGMWTAGSARALVDRYAAIGDLRRMCAYSVTFVDVVFPGDRLTTSMHHVGMDDGQMLIEGETINQKGSVVLRFSAKIEQPNIAYVFTGQGTQYVGMGMDLYSSSPEAKSVWDRADKHMFERYGVSLLEIVRKNPQQYRVRFDGKLGDQIRACYLSLVKNTSESSSALLPGLTEMSTHYTHKCANGLLNAAIFTQPAQTVMCIAQVADMRSKGLIQQHAAYAGHSLGELGALFAISGIVSVEDAVDIALYRGLLLHASVPRDKQGLSEYAMVSVNIPNIGNAFDEAALLQAVNAISKHHDQLLEVINYNIKGAQYVVTGHRSSLAIMSLVFDRLSHIGSRIEAGSLVKIVESAAANANIPAMLTNGTATIVIPGVDVPSHSSQLATSVAAFRCALERTIPESSVKYDRLHRKYIPNMTGLPFELSQQYLKTVFNVCGSPVVAQMLGYAHAFDSANVHAMNTLARTLLIELLAYQFASPVRWADTQTTLFGLCGVKQLVEIGPGPTLCRMAEQIFDKCAPKWYGYKALHITRDADLLYYGGSPISKQPAEDGSSANLAPAVLKATETQPVQIPDVSGPSSSAHVVSVVDSPLEMVDVIRAVVAQKMRRSFLEVPTTKSIKELVAGKSTIQNEIAADLQKELDKRIPDRGEELPIKDLAKGLGTFSGRLGKHTLAMFLRLVASKLPSSFPQSVVRNHLKTVFGFGPQRQDGVILLAITTEPPARLPDDDAAKRWLDGIANAYLKWQGITRIATPASIIKADAITPDCSNAVLDRIENSQRAVATQQIQVLARQIGIDLRSGSRALEQSEKRVAELEAQLGRVRDELGEKLVDGTIGMFDRKKTRRFASYWNWARQDALSWIYSILIDGTSTEDTHFFTTRLSMLKNRSTPGLVSMLKAVMSMVGKCNDEHSQRAYKLTERLCKECELALELPPMYRALFTSLSPKTTVSPKGDIAYTEVPRVNEISVAEYCEHMQEVADGKLPRLYMYEHSDCWEWTFSKSQTDILFDALKDISEHGMSFEGRTALVTGCNQGSIGSGILEALLAGGAKVVATTSSYSLRSTRYFETVYRKFGSRGSELILVPFNQGSVQDVKALVDYIYSEDGLGWDLNYAVPFASVAERGRNLANIDPYSELAMRTSLTNIIRLLGEIMSAKAKHNFRLSPTLVLLPHSSNYGVVGNDGLYSMSKMGLQTLYRRWYAEDWDQYLSLTGADIGWVRNTSMTSDGQMLYEDINRVCRTFSREEMSFNLIALLSPSMARLSAETPVFGNFNGGTVGTVDTQKQMLKARNKIIAKSLTRKAVVSGLVHDGNIEGAGNLGSFFIRERTAPLANHRYDYPKVRTFEQLSHLRHLQGMINLDKVVVVTGYGEVGPFGNAALRWEMEAFGEFSLEGCIELAWIMGYIKHFSGQHPLIGKHYIGWVDARTSEPVHDMDIKARYEQSILEHSGIRVVEPELHDGYDPKKKSMMRELQIGQDLEPFETSAEEAANFKLGNGDKVDVWENGDGSWSVQFLKGAVLLVPKALRFDRYVASQLPTGWDPVRFGIPETMLEHIDPVTSYALVATVEALVRSGVTDPYELYQYFHVSEVGYSIGSSMGGGKSIQKIFRGRWMDKNAHVETGVEVTTNCISAWINMILISAAGSLKPPVGACATVAMSLDIGIETIQSGKAKIMIVGASDSFAEDSAYELGQLGATASADNDALHGREPAEMSRPCTSTRGGFVEGYGSGIAVLMSASAALEMGAPVYGILALSTMATDKASHNLTAPGQGLMTAARERHTGQLPILDVNYRRRMLDCQLRAIDSWKMDEITQIERSVVGMDSNQRGDINGKIRSIVADAHRQHREALNACGNDFWKDNPQISPLRGALATWGLDADAISIASFHGTSTALNDRNESEVIHRQMQHLGRTPGLPVHVVCQKWLTGHPKGVAASWMLNGLLQSMAAGIIPGNRNADDIDADFEQFEYLVYPSHSMRVPSIKAGLLTSFGFGQAGGEILVIHPDYLFGTQTKEELETYMEKVKHRQNKSYRYLHDTLVGNHTFVQPKEAPPFAPEQELQVYLDPLARTKYDPVTKTYQF